MDMSDVWECLSTDHSVQNWLIPQAVERFSGCTHDETTLSVGLRSTMVGKALVQIVAASELEQPLCGHCTDTERRLDEILRDFDGYEVSEKCYCSST